jgi:hypothetical protein
VVTVDTRVRVDMPPTAAAAAAGESGSGGGEWRTLGAMLHSPRCLKLELGIQNARADGTDLEVLGCSAVVGAAEGSPVAPIVAAAVARAKPAKGGLGAIASALQRQLFAKDIRRSELIAGGGAVPMATVAPTAIQPGAPQFSPTVEKMFLSNSNMPSANPMTYLGHEAASHSSKAQKKPGSSLRTLAASVANQLAISAASTEPSAKKVAARSAFLLEGTRTHAKDGQLPAPTFVRQSNRPDNLSLVW